MKTEIQYDVDSDDYYIELSEELCEELGWTVGDNIVWEKIDNDSFVLRKKQDDKIQSEV